MLRQYRNIVWDSIEQFDAFRIIDWLDRSKNQVAYLLANVALSPNDITFVGISKVEV